MSKRTKTQDHTTAGTAMVVHPSPTRTDQDKKPEKIAAKQDLIVPAELLLAAEAATAKDDPKRPALQGVYLHIVERTVRVVGTDGSRMFVGSFTMKEKETAPAWLAAGVILSNVGLRARVSMIAKTGSEQVVRISYAKDLPKAQLTDADKTMSFDMPRVEGMFPQYERVIPMASFARLDEFGEVERGKEWEPVGINSQFLKHVGDIAKTLEASLPKEKRTKTGMVIRAYNATENSDGANPLVFDFSNYPGAILCVMPMKIEAKMAPETAALLAPAIKLTLAALRAHATRWLKQADTVKGDAKDSALRKAQEFQDRIAAILEKVPASPAITDASEATAEETTTDEPAAEAMAEEQFEEELAA